MQNKINQDVDGKSPIERANEKGIAEVIRLTGLALQKQSDGSYRGKSIEPGTSETALSVDVRKGVWHDFKLNKGGDAVGLYAEVTGLTQYEAALEILGETDTSGHAFNREKKSEQLKRLQSDVERFYRCGINFAEFRDYMHSRRITDKTIDYYKIGVVPNGEYNGGRIAIPYYIANKQGQADTEKPLYCIFRHFQDNEPDTKYKKLAINEKSPFSELKSRLLFEDTIPRPEKDRQILFIGEGVIDGLSIAQERLSGQILYSALFYGGGNPNKDNLAIVREYAASFKRVILVFDSDKSGEQFTYDTGYLLMQDGIDFDVIRNYGAGHKDLSDYYTDGGDIAELLDTAKNGYDWLCDSFLAKHPYSGSKNDKIEAKKRLKEFYAVYKKAVEKEAMEMKNLIEACIKSGYSKDFLAMIDEATKPKNHEMQGKTRDTFLRNHKLFSYGDDKGACYYEYKKQSGEWVKTTSGYIKNRIADLLEKLNGGCYKVSELNQIYELIQHKIAIEKMPDFNRQPLWRFRNCYLDLETGERHTPQPDDFISGGSRDYDYNPDAKCDKFDKFLMDITGGEQSRIATIWKFIAYILFPDNRLGQAPLFIGDEGSGKSTLLEVISAFADDEEHTNVTNIQPKSMTNPFTRSNLQYSLLNVADDVHKTLGKGLSYIKNAITGQPIDVERKFEKNISIRSRAKWFLSANELPKAETLLGLERRLIFIRIVGKFGVGKDAKKANLNMAEELKSELSGIFNRAYELYKQMIKTSERIAPCIDQQDLMTEFKSMNDDVLTFMSDKFDDLLTAHTQATAKEIFEEYLIWAKNLNMRELKPKKQFSTELNRHIRKGNIKGLEKKHRESGDIYIFRDMLLEKTVQSEDTSEAEQPTQQTEQPLLMPDVTPPEAEPQSSTEPPEKMTLKEFCKKNNREKYYELYQAMSGKKDIDIYDAIAMQSKIASEPDVMSVEKYFLNQLKEFARTA